MIIRKEYRGCIKSGISREILEKTCRSAEMRVREMIKEKRLLTASLYEYKEMCFLYYEALEEELKPEDFLTDMEAILEMWPEEQGKTPWAEMYPVFWHQIPQTEEQWQKARTNENKTRIGRIAFLHPEKLFSYTYWHKALVDEGLLKGDQYQFISLHENILFSYFETPKHMVNIRQMEAQSDVIDGWTEADPESHFDREKAGGENFRILPALFSAGGDAEE